MTYQIFCDSRELRSLVIKELDRMGVDITIKTLEVGDYVVSDRVAFERKTIDDFLKSWIDEKKLFTQIYDLKVSYEKPILLVEGFQDELYTLRRIDPRAVQGCLNTIAIMGIPTLYSINPAGSAKIISMIAKKEQNDNKKEFSFHGKRSHLSKNEQLIYIISAIPDVGPVNARNLLKYFGTIENMSQAGISDLMCVDGIGEKTACSIRNLVTENYNNMEI